METSSEPFYNAKLSLLEFVPFKHRKRGASATQLLWGKLEADASLLMLSAEREDMTPQDKLTIEQCRQKLELAKSCIDRFVKKPLAFWEIIHEVDALLVLVLPRELLANRALEVLQKFETKVTDPTTRLLWLGETSKPGPLLYVTRLLTQERAGAPEGTGVSTLSAAQQSYCRSVLSGALEVLNEQVDQGFWQLTTNVTIQVASALLLLGLFVLWWFMTNKRLQDFLHLEKLFLIDLSTSSDPSRYFDPAWQAQVTDIPFLVLLPFIMFGVAGAILSNMLSKRPFIVSTGATNRFYLYNLMVKPLLGGFAALFLLFVERSDLLLAVVLQYSDVPVVSRAAVQIPVYSIQSAVFTIAILSLAAGFFSHKFLSSMMDKVHDLLFKKSEKSQPSVLPPAPATSVAPPPREMFSKISQRGARGHVSKRVKPHESP